MDALDDVEHQLGGAVSVGRSAHAQCVHQHRVQRRREERLGKFAQEVLENTCKRERLRVRRDGGSKSIR